MTEIIYCSYINCNNTLCPVHQIHMPMVAGEVYKVCNYYDNCEYIKNNLKNS